MASSEWRVRYRLWLRVPALSSRDFFTVLPNRIEVRMHHLSPFNRIQINADRSLPRVTHDRYQHGREEISDLLTLGAMFPVRVDDNRNLVQSQPTIILSPDTDA